MGSDGTGQDPGGIYCQAGGSVLLAAGWGKSSRLWGRVYSDGLTGRAVLVKGETTGHSLADPRSSRQRPINGQDA